MRNKPTHFHLQITIRRRFLCIPLRRNVSIAPSNFSILRPSLVPPGITFLHCYMAPSKCKKVTIAQWPFMVIMENRYNRLWKALQDLLTQLTWAVSLKANFHIQIIAYLSQGTKLIVLDSKSSHKFRQEIWNHLFFFWKKLCFRSLWDMLLWICTVCSFFYLILLNLWFYGCLSRYFIGNYMNSCKKILAKLDWWETGCYGYVWPHANNHASSLM